MADFDKAMFYAFTPDEARALSPYMGKLTPKIIDWFHIPEVVGEVLQNSTDAIGAGWIIIGYLDRTGLLNKMIPWAKSRVIKAKETVDNAAQSGRDTSTVSSNGHSAPGDGWPDIKGAPIGAQYAAE